MNRESFNTLVEDIQTRRLAVMQSKGNDYADVLDSTDCLNNFKKHSASLGVTPLQVWGVFAGKHWDSVMSYIKNSGSVESEPIESRLDDLRNYLDLLEAIIIESQTE